MKTLWMLYTVLFLAAFTACSSTPDNKADSEPDWVSGQSAEYRSSQYLTGVGSANTLDAARDRARADLSKTFQVAINARTQDQQSSQRDGASVLFEERINRYVTSETQQVIQGIEIVDTWRDPKSKTHYALAALNRLKSGQALRSQIKTQDQETGNWIQAARDSNSLWQQIRNASLAINSHSKRQALQRNLQVVDITGRGLPSEQSLASLTQQWKTLIGRMTIDVQAQPDSKTAVVESALSNLGAQLGSGDYRLSAQYSETSLGQLQGWYWQQGRLNLQLSDSQGKVLAEDELVEKEAATQEALAQQRLSSKIDQGIAQSIAAFFDASAN